MLYQNHIKKASCIFIFLLTCMLICGIVNCNLIVIQKLGAEMGKTNKEKPATLRFYSQQWQDLEEIADKNGTSVSQQIRDAVERYIIDQKPPNSLSLLKKQMAQRTTLEKVVLVGSSLLAAFAIVCYNDVRMGLLRQILLTSGITLAFLALFYRNSLKRHWGKITIAVVDVVSIIGLATFWFAPDCQSLVGTIFLWFGGGLIGTFFVFFLIFKIYGLKID